MDLDESNWNYYIVEYKFDTVYNGWLLQDINSCLFLNKKLLSPLTIPTINNEPHGLMWDDIVMSYYYGLPVINLYYRSMFEPMIFGATVELTLSLLNNLKEDYMKFISYKDGEFSFVCKSINSFSWSAKSPSFMPLKIVELFSVIELLISHKPMDNDSYGTITKQLCNKLNLINNRLSDPFSIKTFFDPIIIQDKSKRESMQKKFSIFEIIKRLYEFRSNVAHGNESDFKTDLLILQSEDNAIRFLENELIPKLLKFSLREPQLVKDIKLC